MKMRLYLCSRFVNEYEDDTDADVVHADLRKPVRTLLAGQNDVGVCFIDGYGHTTTSQNTDGTKDRVVMVYENCPDIRDTSKMDLWQINNSYHAYDLDDVKPEHKDQVMLLNAASGEKDLITVAIAGVGTKWGGNMLNGRPTFYYNVVTKEDMDQLGQLVSDHMAKPLDM